MTFIYENDLLIIGDILCCCQQIDVYSFGVLLCEMCIRELPDPKQREEQVALVTNHVFRGLIRRCIQKDPEARPNMEEIIDDLDSS